MPLVVAMSGNVKQQSVLIVHVFMIWGESTNEFDGLVWFITSPTWSSRKVLQSTLAVHGPCIHTFLCTQSAFLTQATTHSYTVSVWK